MNIEGTLSNPENINNTERIIARKIEDLPHLKEGHVRLVHLTNIANVENISQTGLNYEKYGMIQSMVRIWGNEEDVEFKSGDPRFQGENIAAIVMDISYEELRLHDDVAKSPGVLSPDHIVGIIAI